MVGGQVTERRSEGRPVECVADCLAQPRVGERAMPGVEGQFAGGQQRRHVGAARLSRGRLAEAARDRGLLGEGGGRLGDVVGPVGSDVGHRLAGPRLLEVDDGGEPRNGAGGGLPIQHHPHGYGPLPGSMAAGR
jgi:hypothetical protein